MIATAAEPATAQSTTSASAFPVADIVSILAEQYLGGANHTSVYQLVKLLAPAQLWQQQVMTHAVRECKPAIAKQHAELAELVVAFACNTELMLSEARARFGATVEISK